MLLRCFIWFPSVCFFNKKKKKTFFNLFTLACFRVANEIKNTKTRIIESRSEGASCGSREMKLNRLPSSSTVATFSNSISMYGGGGGGKNVNFSIPRRISNCNNSWNRGMKLEVAMREKNKSFRERISMIEEERNIRRSEIIYSREQWYLMNSGLFEEKKKEKKKKRN